MRSKINNPISEKVKKVSKNLVFERFIDLVRLSKSENSRFQKGKT